MAGRRRHVLDREDYFCFYFFSSSLGRRPMEIRRGTMLSDVESCGALWFCYGGRVGRDGSHFCPSVYR